MKNGDRLKPECAIGISGIRSYEVDCRPQGRNGKRYRKKFTTKGEAQKYERWLLSTQNQKGWVEMIRRCKLNFRYKKTSVWRLYLTLQHQITLAICSTLAIFSPSQMNS